jgi:hypothetical protein
LLHIKTNPQHPGKHHALIFLSLSRARILIHFSRDSTGNRKDCGIKIFIYTFVVAHQWSYFGASLQTIQVGSITYMVLRLKKSKGKKRSGAETKITLWE